MQRDGGQAAVPAELLFLPPSSTGDPSPGSSMIWTHSRGLASLPMQLNTPARPGDSKEQDTEEPKVGTTVILTVQTEKLRHGAITNLPNAALQKRKGGWPKGKKRKPPRDLSVPRAPTTGYVIFLNEQRSQLRAKHPNLPFTEITKILAAQWAQLSQERKQRYIYAADEDKQRYIRELQAYQSSEAYRAFLRRRAAHRALCGPGAPGGELEREDLDLSAMNASEDGDLRCRTCHQCFSSQHNKREHLLGRQHLHNLTGEFEKDSAKYLRHLEPPQEEEGRMHKTESEEEAEGPGAIGPGALAPGETFASLDLSFWQEFFWKLLKVKEFELGELRSTLGRAQAEQEALQRQLAEFQSQQQRLEVELAGLRTCGLVLEKELENLNMLLLLSCFSLQMADTA